MKSHSLDPGSREREHQSQRASDIAFSPCPNCNMIAAQTETTIGELLPVMDKASHLSLSIRYQSPSLLSPQHRS